MIEIDFRLRARKLKKIAKGSVNMIFTSPPYYNARMYTNYKSYEDYLSQERFEDHAS